VQLPDDRRAFADGRADALDGTAADVADGEGAFDAGRLLGVSPDLLTCEGGRVDREARRVRA
jgi:hypothetical protein